MITPLNLPKAPLKLSKKGDKLYVWCLLRNKKLILTPEEWVRQHLIHFLNIERKIPLGRMVAEYRINYNGRIKRADIVAFDEEGKPILVAECKAPEVAIEDETLFQIAQYQKEIGARELILSNGLNHYAASLENDDVSWTSF